MTELSNERLLGVAGEEIEDEETTEGGIDPTVVTPREGQGDQPAGADEGKRELSGTGGEVPPAKVDDGTVTADEGSVGGTGGDTVTGLGDTGRTT